MDLALRLDDAAASPTTPRGQHQQASIQNQERELRLGRRIGEATGARLVRHLSFREHSPVMQYGFSSRLSRSTRMFGDFFMNSIGGRSSRYQLAEISISSVSCPRCSGTIHSFGCAPRQRLPANAPAPASKSVCFFDGNPPEHSDRDLTLCVKLHCEAASGTADVGDGHLALF